MRILIASEDIPYPSMGGLAKHALTLARALVRLGHEVDILGGSQHPIEVAGEEGRFGGRFFGELDGHDIGWKEAALGMYLPPRRTWVARRFARIILRHAGAYDVVHYHGHAPNVARFIPAHVNFVQTRHDQGGDCLLNTRFRAGQVCESTAPADCASCRHPHPNALQTALSAAAVRRYRTEVAAAFRRHKTVFVSDMVHRNFARTAGPGPWGVTVHNFVDLESIATARAAARAGPADETRVFVAAKLYPAKGIEPFLRELAPAMPPGMQVSIAGDGADLARLSAEFGGARIHFLGWCDMQSTLALAAAAHAIAVPSVWEEPCGTTVLEALLLGKPTFALARGGTPELAVYAAAPKQLRLFPDMRSLVGDLRSFRPVPDYPMPENGLGGVGRAAERLLEIYRLPPGQPLA
jgi:glycosyltransferase involved in cell wall biosynthesis